MEVVLSRGSKISPTFIVETVRLKLRLVLLWRFDPWLRMKTLGGVP